MTPPLPTRPMALPEEPPEGAEVPAPGAPPRPEPPRPVGPDAASELKVLLELAAPAILSALAYMTIGIVDTAMVGHLGALPLAAVGVANVLFATVMLLAGGTLGGLTPLVSQAHGAGRMDRCVRWLWQGVWWGLLTGVLLMLAFRHGGFLLGHLGQDPRVVPDAAAYLAARALGVIPALVYRPHHLFLYGLGRMRPVLAAVVATNLVNVVGNYALIHGAWGFPALGVEGAGYASAISQSFLACLGIWLVHAHFRLSRGHPVTLPQPARLRELVRLGLPIGLQISAEQGIFSVVALLAGWMAPLALSAHQITFQATIFTFMAPLGVAEAAATRVGNLLGADRRPAAERAGRMCLWMGLALMGACSLVLLVVPSWVARVFTDDPALVTKAAELLRVAAFFQVADGLQVIAAGCLRGAGEVRIPLVASLVVYWTVGLPVGAGLAFGLGWGVVGLWWGMTLALVLKAVWLTGRFLRGTWENRVVAEEEDGE